MDVTLDQAAINRLVVDPDVQRDLQRRTDLVVQAAKSTAPVLTGAYRASIHQEPQYDADGARTVTADVHYAIYVEHGTRQTDRHGRSIHPARFTLTRALDAAGGDS